MPMRVGCVLALGISLLLVAALELGRWLVNESALRNDNWDLYLYLLVIIGIPFVMLAVAGTRDRLAWLVGIGLTAAAWGYQLYDLSRHRGANFGYALFLMFIAPLLIAACSVTTAGVRGRIPWAKD